MTITITAAEIECVSAFLANRYELWRVQCEALCVDPNRLPRMLAEAYALALKEEESTP